MALVLTCCASVLLTTSAAALADGGGSIAGATAATPGVQEFGNTINGGQSPGGCDEGTHYRSWWNVAVAAGDQVTIDWSTQLTDMTLNIYPEGTTDYSFGNTDSVVQQQVNDNYANEATYTVPADGTLPFEFVSDSGCADNPPGPYNFTLSVQHGVVLAVPAASAIATAGAFPVSVKTPDGGPINDPSLTVTLYLDDDDDFGSEDDSSQVAIGTAAAVNGTATVDYAVPSSDYGQRGYYIEAIATGASYVTAASSSDEVNVASPAPAPTSTPTPVPTPAPIVAAPACVVPGYHAGEKLGRVKAAIVANHCTVGRIVRIRSGVRRGRVVALSPPPRTSKASYGRVLILISKGRG